MEEFVVSNGNLLIELIDKINKVEEADNFDDKIKYLLHFVSTVSKCKRGRICSYYNNFYRFNSIEYNFDEVKLDKVLKYKKKKDTDELLKLGEIPWIGLTVAITFSIYGLIRKKIKVSFAESCTVGATIRKAF